MAELVQSYVHGVSSVPLIGETIGAHFDKAAERDPPAARADRAAAKPALELRRRKPTVDAFAAGLLALGLSPGDRVGIWAPNNAESVILTQSRCGSRGSSSSTSTCLSPFRARLQQGRLQGAGHRRFFKTS